MSVVCPQCQSTIEDALEGQVVCPSCGSTFDSTDGATIEWGLPKPGRTFGKFELIKEAGAGAFGCVYQARDTELGRTVAVKIPRPGSLGGKGDSARFLREARSVAQLRHPSIVPVFEIGQDSGHPFLVSEFIDGITLDDLMTSERLEPKTAADLVAKLAEALDYAHSRGVVHRDVKPSNVMLEMPERDRKGTDSGRTIRRYVPRLMDFGLAKHDDGELTMTVQGDVIGTPAYMSPEQARGDGHAVDGRSDVYSLGVILYQILTGELPFKGNARMLVHQVLNDEPWTPRSRVATVPRDLEAICLKAMAKEPARRYETAGELGADLRRFVDDEPILARPVSLRQRVLRRVRRNPTVVVLATAVLVLSGIMVGIVLNLRRPAPPPPPPAVAKTKPAARTPADTLNNKPAVETPADELLKVVAEIDRTDPDWRLDEIEAKLPKIPEDENGALLIIGFRKTAGKLMGQPYPISNGSWSNPDTDRILDALARYSPPVRLSQGDAAAARLELKRVAALVSVARRMLAFPRGRFLIQHTRASFGTPLPDIQAGREVIRLLDLDASVQIQEGNRKEAADDCVTMLNIARYCDGQPIPISQFVRASNIRQAIRRIEHIEARGEGTEVELETFQGMIEEAANVPTLLTMARGERGSVHYFLSTIEAGDISNDTLQMLGLEDRSQLPNSQDIRRTHAWILKTWSNFAEIARRPPEQQFPLLAQIDSRIRDAFLEGMPFLKHVLDVGTPSDSVLARHFHQIVNFNARHLALCRSAATGLAVERYRLAHKEWPSDLAALVPLYLKELPVDPFDGQPLRYRRTFDGAVIYSIGDDRVDHQGKILVEYQGRVIRPPQADRNQTDEGFQLWDVSRRNQPASPEIP